ncbi:MAG: hypothetical protein FJY88_04145 [Candidatus Eisenbacteria bacterium]|nr:hypothetical protein [Candidatus Eisenbacteria bacterium]
MTRSGGDPTGEGKAGERSSRDIDPVRLAAFGILHRSARGRRSIDKALRLAAAAHEERDRRFLWALVVETLRWRARLDAVLEPLLHRPLMSLDPSVRILLEMAACQVCVLDSIPPHAVVDEAVRLAAKVAPSGAERMVNAVSRRLTQDGAARWALVGGASDPAQWCVAHSHPRWLVDRWLQRWGEERTLSVLRWNNEHAPVWLRARRGGRAPEGERGWVADTYRMPRSYRPADDPSFLSGEWTAQDPGETLVGLLPPETPDGWLIDLCASPGTKTTHLAERFGAGRVLAMDRRRSRMVRLRETLARTGDRCPLMVADALALPLRPGIAAGVLLDAPCSALGVLRRRVDARWNVRESDLLRHRDEQIRMLDAAAGLVRRGGWLLYSVCSTEPEETDDVRDRFLARHRGIRPLTIPIATPEDVEKGDGCLRILPGQGACDGVYASLFRC